VTDLDGRLGARQIQGDRDYQEDDFGISHVHRVGDEGEHILLVLADGMGGHVAGATASALAVRRFVEAFEEIEGTVAQRLRFALDASNDEIRAAIKSNPEMDGMGCTLVGVSITAVGMQWVSVGDSPLWVFHDGELVRLNADHSMAPVIANLVEAGHMTPEEAANDKRKNALRSAVMGDEMELVDLKEEPVEVQPQARIIVASDGLETLETDEITAILNEYSGESARQTVAALIAGVEAKAKPGQDNTTALLFEPGGFLEGSEDSMKPDEVKSIVRRAKGLKKGESEPDPKTIPGAQSKKSGSQSGSLVAVIAILLAALLAALAWIFLTDREKETESALLPQTSGEDTPPAVEGEAIDPGEQPLEESAEPVEEPVIEREEAGPPPVSMTPARAPETEGREEVPVESKEDPGETPSLIPSVGEGGGQQPAENPPEVAEEGQEGTVTPGGQPGAERETPASGAVKVPEATGEKKKEEKEEEEKKEPPPL
jgi:protein phosphatase